VKGARLALVVAVGVVADIERGEPQRIGDTRVTLTIFDGKVVYEQAVER